MTKWMLAAGAAALAIAAPSAAERGEGKGGQKSTHVQKSDRSGGGQKARSQRGGGERQARAQRGGGSHEARAGRSDRGGDRARSQQMRFAQNDDRGRGRGGEKVRVNNSGNDRGRDQVRVQNRGGEARRETQNRQARFENRGDTRRANQGRNDVRFDSRGADRSGIVRVDNRGRGRENVRTVKVDRDAIRGKGNARFAVVDGNDIVRVRDIDRGVVRFRDVDRDDLFVRRLGFGAGGCPPGLAKKAVSCMPPGQAAKLVGEPIVVANRFGALAAVPVPLRSFYYDNDDYYYRYGGNYMYRVDRDDDLIDAMIPLFGASLIGQPLQPYYYQNSYVPPYYSAFYPNSQYDCYNYGYGYVYETDCMTGLVEDVIPTYDYGYGVGQLLPSSYSYYNLPYNYRSAFMDDDDYYYRYAPGAIYRVDRETSLISAVAALLTGGLTVGQPLPMGYGTYNVPMAYRDTYYDSPDAWYRYNNGYIYEVDPVTQLVRSIAYAIT